MENYDYVVLGGGISGLSYAHFLSKKGFSVKLLESSNRFGGIIKTDKQDGFIFETGPNTIVNKTAGIQELIEDLKLTDQLIYSSKKAANERYILHQNKLKVLPTSPISMLTKSFFTFNEKLHILREFIFSSKQNFENSTVEEFMTARFGKGVYKKVVVPFLSGVFAGDPSRQPMKFVMAEILKMYQENGSVLKGLVKRQKGSKKSGGEFFSLPEGLEELAKRIVEKNQAIYLPNSKVLNVTKREDEHLTTYLQEGEERTITSRKVISCLPLHVLRTVLGAEFNKEVSEKIEYAPVVSMQFGFKKEQLKNFPEGFGVLPEEEENKSYLGVLFNSNFFPHQAPINQVLLTVIAGGMMHKNIGLMEEDLLKVKILEEMNDLFQIKGNPLCYHFTRWKEGIPQFTENHQKVINQIHAYEGDNNGIYIRGNFLNGPSVANCIDKALNFASSQKPLN